MHSQYAEEVSLVQLTTEVMVRFFREKQENDQITSHQPAADLRLQMVKLSSRIVKHLTGFAHIQTNPYYSYSESKNIANAERKHSLVPPFPNHLPN